MKSEKNSAKSERREKKKKKRRITSSGKSVFLIARLRRQTGPKNRQH